MCFNLQPIRKKTFFFDNDLFLYVTNKQAYEQKYILCYWFGLQAASDYTKVQSYYLKMHTAKKCKNTFIKLFLFLDYDQKKLLATKAIQTKPAGEPRTPTPSW